MAGYSLIGSGRLSNSRCPQATIPPSLPGQLIRASMPAAAAGMDAISGAGARELVGSRMMGCCRGWAAGCCPFRLQGAFTFGQLAPLKWLAMRLLPSA